MNITEFNLLNLNDKWEFILNRLQGQHYGAVNDLVLPNIIIYFQCALATGECIKAEAEPLPEKYKAELIAQFGDYEAILFNMILRHLLRPTFLR